MQPVLLKRYANRKLYVTKGNTEPSGYIALHGIIDIIRKGKDVKIICNVSKMDITAEVLKGALEYVTLDTDTLIQLLRSGSQGGNSQV